MSLLIHAGMNKTGSSSIQNYLKQHDLGAVRYMEWRTANHSALFALLFHEPVEEYHSFRGRGETREALLRERTVWLERVAGQLDANRDRTIVMSAEDISGPYPDAVRRMGEFFARFTSDIKVVAYVRPPISFMQSAFQQRVASGGLDCLNTAGLWPGYRGRFEKLDEAFGAHNVTLRRYASDALRGGDVVLDFCDVLGVSPSGYTPVRDNSSLSLEALSLIFLQRKLGEGFVRGYRQAHESNTRFLRVLSTVGRRKLAFAPELVAPMIARNRADVAWIEERLGEPLLDVPQEDGDLIASEADLLAVAQDCRKELDDVLCRAVRMTQRGEDETAIDRLAHKLDVLRQLLA
ncbi:MAG: hypothetical protein AcusKO_34320 [Acuticoccus sp.]